MLWWIYIGALASLLFVNLGVSIARHGEPETGTNNAWVYLVGMSLHAPLFFMAAMWLLKGD